MNVADLKVCFILSATMSVACFSMEWPMFALYFKQQQQKITQNILGENNELLLPNRVCVLCIWVCSSVSHIRRVFHPAINSVKVSKWLQWQRIH